MKILSKIAVLLVLILVTACTNSLLYSPSLGLSADMLKGQELDISGGTGILAETRPQGQHYLRMGEHSIPSVDDLSSYGAYLKVGYGFTDKFNLYASTWRGFDYQYRGGLEFSSRIGLLSSEKYALELIPRTAFVIDQNVIQGHGFSIPLAFIYKFNQKFYTYVGAGPIAGYMTEKNISTEFGYGAISHFAVGYNYSNFRFTLEICPIYFYNRYDNRTDFIASPALSIGYILK